MFNFFSILNNNTNEILILNIIVLVLFGLICIKSINYIITKFFNSFFKTSILSDEKENIIKTYVLILKNIISFLIVGIIIVTILSDLNMDVLPILTGAGFIGLVLSLGTQSIVKDLVKGMFLILDNNLQLGQHVELSGIKGIVKKIEIRNITILDSEGNVNIIPNSKVDKIKIYKN